MREEEGKRVQNNRQSRLRGGGGAKTENKEPQASPSAGQLMGPWEERGRDPHRGSVRGPFPRSRRRLPSSPQSHHFGWLSGPQPRPAHSRLSMLTVPCVLSQTACRDGIGIIPR